MVAILSSPIYWKSQRQFLVALSSAEAEYVALSTCAINVSWLRRLYWEITHQHLFLMTAVMHPVTMFTDNTAALAISHSEQRSLKSKHIDTKFDHVRDMLRQNAIQLQYIHSSLQVADIFTKAAPTKILNQHLKTMHVGPKPTLT